MRIFDLLTQNALLFRCLLGYGFGHPFWFRGAVQGMSCADSLKCMNIRVAWRREGGCNITYERCESMCRIRAKVYADANSVDDHLRAVVNIIYK